MSEFTHFTEPYPTYQEVANSDPLSADGVMAQLPELNRFGKVDDLVFFTGKAVAESVALQDPTKTEALAAIRDLDFLASSVLRHGTDPLIAVPGLEEQFIRLGSLANTVPRGTVFTYAAANPTGQRRRSFTGSHEEDVFIDSVTRSIIALDTAVDGLSTAGLTDSARLTDGLRRSSGAMDEMIDSIVQVRRTVSPEYFTFEMRPYFEPLVIGGHSLTGSGGAQMQLLAVDRMLWGCEDQTPDYEAFFQENFMYLTPAQQKALAQYAGINGGKSIVGWLYENRGQDPEANQAAIDLLKRVKKFRYPHRRIAQDNFKLRPSDAVGSGAYKPNILDVLIEKTEISIAMLEEAANA